MARTIVPREYQIEAENFVESLSDEEIDYLYSILKPANASCSKKQVLVEYRRNALSVKPKKPDFTADPDFEKIKESYRK